MLHQERERKKETERERERERGATPAEADSLSALKACMQRVEKEMP